MAAKTIKLKSGVVGSHGSLRTWTIKLNQSLVVDDSVSVSFGVAGFYEDSEVLEGLFDVTPAYLKSLEESME